MLIKPERQLSSQLRLLIENELVTVSSLHPVDLGDPLEYESRSIELFAGDEKPRGLRHLGNENNADKVQDDIRNLQVGPIVTDVREVSDVNQIDARLCHKLDSRHDDLGLFWLELKVVRVSDVVAGCDANPKQKDTSVGDPDILVDH